MTHTLFHRNSVPQSARAASKRARPRAWRYWFRAELEALETRVTPSTFTVSTTADSGAGSLRQAITDANTAGGSNTINFTITGIIQLQSALPAITNNLDIEGPGASSLSMRGQLRRNQRFSHPHV